ncbi:putative bifunctional diguanylate cyclase/phosphodiesterase [Vibrio caribbeanicus]|uniref:putative bifunctional diguanylate cyclase/phosphodiesterase n=1 Tax=Vibrio caribbeanicus TaxID=701175 RepID=UPI00228387C4|nr:bifunctional diguanylate cyclase/phosphodiesterase [Vibrio caribbeanicus]MCY9843606.1 bifunctional diguanylate cyclase/phosphodiesterase [Vibrio caribbeanicus]
MSSLNTLNVSIPEETRLGWQRMLELLNDTLKAKSIFIACNIEQRIEVLCIASSGDYDSKTTQAIQASQHSSSSHNATSNTTVGYIEALDLAEAAINLPIAWPSGEVFGHIYVISDSFNEQFKHNSMLLDSFKISVENQLFLISTLHRLKNNNNHLKSCNSEHSLRISNLNQSLNQEKDRRLAAEQQLVYQKSYDPATGFLNKQTLEHETEKLLNEVEYSKSKLVGVMHMHFTNGATIESQYGYTVWDKLLVEFRRRLEKHNELEVITARPVTNELVFVWKMQDDTRDLKALSSELIETSRSTFVIDNNTIHLNCCIGASTTKDTNDARQLLSFAAAAMSSCQKSKQNFHRYSDSLSNVNRYMEQQEAYLLQAVRDKNISIYFQPKVCPIQRKWIGAEALLRWQHPNLGNISNENLIHLAEQNGLIYEVGSFVLHSAIEIAAKWSKSIKQFKISVNVSPLQLQCPRFVDQIKQLLTKHSLAPENLELELTEGSLIADEIVAKATLVELRKLGITLSLDDFGTGYASFNYLKKFPFDVIKIDKSFIENIEKDVTDREIVTSIIHVAKKLHLAVTVEGIETVQQENFIIDQGCEIGQGFLYGKPMSLEDFESKLLSRKKISAQ